MCPPYKPNAYLVALGRRCLMTRVLSVLETSSLLGRPRAGSPRKIGSDAACVVRPTTLMPTGPTTPPPCKE